ncbi:hypothetical protein [Chitinasiproducens palmae]|uniref:Uncharacterized protein n=1 Tax=Chitinasiproducens palmae TaxID=1770053 RepID=A0A1H2PPZ7_9BURK|nr:hypothetical protein [Chitinasiproducens palmae]SDV48405.1 hypothetical protein SAMN05216551_10565 [Chitinasiproducens palmae]
MSLKKFILLAASATTLAGALAPVAAEAAPRRQCRIVHVHGHAERHCWVPRHRMAPRPVHYAPPPPPMGR